MWCIWLWLGYILKWNMGSSTISTPQRGDQQRTGDGGGEAVHVRMSTSNPSESAADSMSSSFWSEEFAERASRSRTGISVSAESTRDRTFSSVSNAASADSTCEPHYQSRNTASTAMGPKPSVLFPQEEGQTVS